MMSKKRGQGEGTIFEERPGRWVAQVSSGYVIRDGKRRRVRKKFVATTREEVHRALTKALGRQLAGRDVSPKKQTVAQFLRSWLEQIATQVRPKTFRTYSDIVKLHLSPILGAIKLERLTPEVVRGFLRDKVGSALCPHCKVSLRCDHAAKHVAEHHQNEKKKPIRTIGPKTVAHIRATLRGALSMAVEDHKLDYNVAAIAKPPRATKPKNVRSLAPKEAQKYMTEAADERLEALFILTLAVGLRQGEVLGLQWEDVNFIEGTLHVRRQLQRIDGTLQLVETKTADGQREIELPAIAIAALKRQAIRQDESRKEAAGAWRGSALVFTTSSGGPIDPRHVIRRHHAILKAAGIEGLRFHDLRHTAASLLLAEFGDAGVKYVSEMLGHKQVAFTIQTYQHALKRAKRRVADKMDSILSSNPVAPQVAPEESAVAVN